MLFVTHISSSNAFTFLALSKFKYRKKTPSLNCYCYFWVVGPFDMNQPSGNNKWDVFKARELHFIHININSILPKIEELRRIACLSNAAVIGISESKLDNSIFYSEIKINGYNILRFDRNRYGGGVACYVRNDLSFTKVNYFPRDIENIL